MLQVLQHKHIPQQDEDKVAIKTCKRSDDHDQLPRVAFSLTEKPLDIQIEFPEPPLHSAQHATTQVKKLKPEAPPQILLLGRRCRYRRARHESAAGNGCE